MTEVVSKSVIHQLPDEVINQIKAGEVVERPLSVVKELVENALDAEADEILIEIYDGGKALIRVIDNGVGMSPEDAKKCLQRHATSKIDDVHDLEMLSTFGFRGEALASIAAVSEFVLVTRRKGDAVGMSVESPLGSADSGSSVSGEVPYLVKPVSATVGTRIDVRNLFGCIPARLKFLKGTATEYAHIADYLQAVSFAFPNVSLSLTHNQRSVFRYRAVTGFMERATQILGNEVDAFVPVDFTKGKFALSGLVSLPTYARSVPRYFLLFVNGRLVKDRIVRAGVLQAYSGLVMKGQVPAVVLFLQCDPAWVDVNAHPSKTEVRFQDALVIQDLVCLGVQDAIHKATQKQSFAPSRPPSVPDGPQFASRVEHAQDVLAAQGDAPQGITPPQKSLQRQGAEALSNPRSMESVRPISLRKSAPPTAMGPDLFASAEPAPRGGQGLSSSGGKPSSPGVSRQTGGLFSSARYLGQYARCYLILECATNRDLMLVDQHAFHERILFEEYRSRAESQPIPKQGLLTPHFVPLPEQLGPLLTTADSLDIFSRLGFEIEWVEAMRHLAVHAMPAFLSPQVLARTLDEVIVRVLGVLEPSFECSHPLLARAESLRAGWVEEGRHFASIKSADLYHLFYATVACHSAVRAGEELAEDKVRFLLARADDVDFAAHCPHGRPVMRRFLQKEVADWFLRS